jgi:hypothetical protein
MSKGNVQGRSEARGEIRSEKGKKLESVHHWPIDAVMTETEKTHGALINATRFPDLPARGNICHDVRMSTSPVVERSSCLHN